MTESGTFTLERSEAAMARARRSLPGGVNSPVRSFQGVGGTPPFFNRAEAQFLFDLDGNRYLDMVLAYGPLILGHLHPSVVAAVSRQLELGEAFGGPTEAEVELAEQIGRRMPSLEMVRLVSSGTEAAMSAIRLARGVTRRDLIVKFAGCYHGHSDSLLAAAGSGVATLSIPGSPGVTQGTVADTVVLPFNDLQAVSELFASSGERIAAVIVEPVPGNMGVVRPREGFLELLQELTKSQGSLLIFDEVISGFRVARGGAQSVFGIAPDLTCLGKVIGGGLPVGAFGGRRELMSRLAPEGEVYQAGTLSGNPLAVAAGLAALRVLDGPEPYQHLEVLGAQLTEGILAAAQRRGRPVQVNRQGSMLTVYFSSEPVTDYQSALRSDRNAFARVHAELLRRGVFWPPSAFESVFLSVRHQPSDLDLVVSAFDAGLAALGPI
ncbi:MAG TPA: glutamate-1-semialdehyde 2,1-aminomutase [Candidatus Micrarchaeaceae archaeon]|nr:glutamate-1-semialdehyde 2,1-aminomutase [Candidatus Micrarchaeaceae archaeon]